MSINLLRGVAGTVFALGLGLLIYGFGFSGGGADVPAAPEPSATSVATPTPAATNTSEPRVTNTAVPSATKTPVPTGTPPATSTAGPGPTGTTVSVTVPASMHPSTSPAAPSPAGTTVPTATPPPLDRSVAFMRIPRFDVDAAVENIGIDDTNHLETPKDPRNVGWYGIYQKPGHGYNALFSAHVDYYPSIRGAFYDLAKMVVGDEVTVVMQGGAEYRYRVIRNDRYTVDTIPTGDLIRASGRPQDDEWITLITCGGMFVPYNGYDGPGYYVHRDVVIAERVQ